MQVLYGHDRDHVTECIAMYIAHVIPLARARTQSLDAPQLLSDNYMTLYV